jgi:hypothetical protein
MPSILIYLEQDEDKKVNEFAEYWKKSKQDVIKRMIREYKPDIKDNLQKKTLERKNEI